MYKRYLFLIGVLALMLTQIHAHSEPSLQASKDLNNPDHPDYNKF